MDALVGRGDDLAAVEGFLDRGTSAGARALLLEGPSGIGKTSLWATGVARARRRGFRVVMARPTKADAALGFLGVSDLLRESVAELRGGAEGPLQKLHHAQRMALATTVDGGGPLPDGRLIHAALLEALRHLADDDGLLIAIDDVQWLDHESASALAFALRRLQDRDVRVLLARRTEELSAEPSPLVLAVATERLVLTALGLDVTVELIADRIGLKLSRAAAKRLHAATGGNPLFSIELASAMAAHPEPGALQDQPLPDRIEFVFEARLSGLPEPARDALLAVSLAGESPWREIAAVVGVDALDAAVDAGVLTLRADRVSVVHPLLADLVHRRSLSGTVRRLHRALAEVSRNPQRTALHLALSTYGPDGDVAQQAAAAAAGASRFGAHPTAAMLADHALRLSEPGTALYEERLVEAAHCHSRAGHASTVLELLRPVAATLSSARRRARAQMLIVDDDDELTDTQRQDGFRAALGELGEDDADLRAVLLANLAAVQAVAAISSITEAEHNAELAYAAAQQTGDVRAREESVAALGWAKAMGGRPLAGLLPEREPGQAPGEVSLGRGIDRVHAVWLTWRGEIAEARRRLQALLQLAEARGEEESYFALRLQLCELELRSGGWRPAQALIDEWARELPIVSYADGYLTRCRALLALGRGDAMDARRLATEFPARGRGQRWNELEAGRVLGMTQLLMGQAEAAETLMRVWRALGAADVGNPGTFPLGADLAEALVAAGRDAEAEGVAAELGSAGADQDHPWARAAAARAHGHVLLSRDQPEAAAEQFRTATARFEALELRLDHGRSLTALGVALRRSRELRASRDTLEAAVHALDTLGSAGWADQARLELARVGGRRRSSTLTPSEQRVAELVREGLPNKQIAQRLVVSTRTVEAHLTRIYRKLGIASRTELAGWLVEQSVWLSAIPDGDERP